MDLKVIPQKLSGTISNIQSKSYLHRYIIASTLSNHDISSFITTYSDDISATYKATSALNNKSDIVNVHESGTTLRLLLPIVTSVKEHNQFVMANSLTKRPIKHLIDILDLGGCHISYKGNVLETKGIFQGGIFDIVGNISSQYISGLLFAFPLTKKGGTLNITTPLSSKPYVDMTLKVLDDFNIKYTYTENLAGYTQFKVKGNQAYCFPDNFSSKTIENDWSNIAFWIVANYLGANINLPYMDFSSLQGDKVIYQYLEMLDTGHTVFNMENCPDLVPIFAVACSVQKDKEILLTGINRLKYKESNRILSTADMINSLGGHITYDNTCLKIKGVSRFSGGYINSYNDHRIVMSSAIASLKSNSPILIKDYNAVNKSYPDFFTQFKKLGGKIIEC